MLARLYVIIESEDIKDYQMIKDLLLFHRVVSMLEKKIVVSFL